jgi:uncharacterized protein YxeA
MIWNRTKIDNMIKYYAETQSELELKIHNESDNADHYWKTWFELSARKTTLMMILRNHDSTDDYLPIKLNQLKDLILNIEVDRQFIPSKSEAKRIIFELIDYIEREG